MTEQQTLEAFGATSNYPSIRDPEQYKNPDWLRGQYKEQGRTVSDIADECNVSDGTISRWLDKHGIESRVGGQSIPENAKENLEDEDWLREEYTEKERSIRGIADELGVSTIIVGRWLYNHEIETRKSGSQLPDAAKEKLPDKEWLREEYVTKVRSSLDIADELGVSATTVGRWLDNHGIEIRSGVRDPDHLEHKVRSNWELLVAELLCENNIRYEYEEVEIVLADGRIYTPDFVTEDYVIEVKGWVRDNRDEEMKAQAAMELLNDREYIVLGAELPCDIHIPWEERVNLIEIVSPQ